MKGKEAYSFLRRLRMRCQEEQERYEDGKPKFLEMVSRSCPLLRRYYVCKHLVITWKDEFTIGDYICALHSINLSEQHRVRCTVGEPVGDQL